MAVRTLFGLPWTHFIDGRSSTTGLQVMKQPPVVAPRHRLFVRPALSERFGLVPLADELADAGGSELLS